MTESKLRRLIDAFGLKEVRYRFDPATRDKAKQSFADKRYHALAELYPVDAGNEKIKEHLKDLFAAHAGVLREDLLLIFQVLLLRTTDEEELLDDFREVIPLEHYNMLLVANSVVKLEDATFSNEARRLRDDAVRHHGETAKRIYNLHRSGYVIGFFHFWLGWLKYEFQKGWKDKFQELWNQELTFFDQAVWCSEEMTSSDVHNEVIKRLMKRGMKEVRVYARGAHKMDLAEAGCTKLLDNYDNVRAERNEYRLGPSACLCFTLKKTDPSQPIRGKS